MEWRDCLPASCIRNRFQHSTSWRLQRLLLEFRCRATAPVDGLNLLPFLTGRAAGQQRTLFWRVFGLGSTGPPASQSTIWAVRSGPLKLVTEESTVNQPPALYNLPNDLGESLDLAASQPADASALSTLYAQWNTQLISPLWFKNSRFFCQNTGIARFGGRLERL